MAGWIFNENKHCGVDYSNKDLAEKYDEQHQKFRDYKKEFDNLIDFLSIKNTRDLSMIDMGCGTGATLVYAAERFKKVYGVDVSETMINQAEKKLSGIKAGNIKFIKAGFLSYRHIDEPADLLITKAAFHHLPDFWKQIALLNMNKMIRMGGILYIFDVVFDFNVEEYEEKISEWISGFEKQAGKKFREETETHIRDEFSTFKWILDKMLEKAGFEIRNCRTYNGFMAEYHCVKVKESGL